MEIDKEQYLAGFRRKSKTPYQICERIAKVIDRPTLQVFGLNNGWSYNDMLYSMDIAEKGGAMAWWIYRRNRKYVWTTN
jgi:hypothetical protein